MILRPSSASASVGRPRSVRGLPNPSDIAVMNDLNCSLLFTDRTTKGAKSKLAHHTGRFPQLPHPCSVTTRRGLMVPGARAPSSFPDSANWAVHGLRSDRVREPCQRLLPL
jgi:hypothetical protein